MFRKKDLKYLDPSGETEEEFHEERELYAERRPSVDSVDLELPGFADFHAEGILNDRRASELQKLTNDEEDEELAVPKPYTDSGSLVYRNKHRDAPPQ
mmetsp:Transcript_11100/g.22695  ORF Transcript_11100/g.22695 Transcript_11100/m.22695 type:complete len:98 (-) Transcript_11100:239-532(-)